MGDSECGSEMGDSKCGSEMGDSECGSEMGDSECGRERVSFGERVSECGRVSVWERV